MASSSNVDFESETLSGCTIDLLRLCVCALTLIQFRMTVIRKHVHSIGHDNDFAKTRINERIQQV